MDELKRRDALDPAVAELVRDAEERQKLRQMPPWKRRKVARDRQRNKLTIDIPLLLQERLEETAEEVGCSVSSLAAFLLAYGLHQVNAGAVDLMEHREWLGNLRFSWRLVIPEEFLGK